MLDLRKILLKNSDGKPCVVTTMFVFGFAVVNFKLLTAGLAVTDKFTLTAFTGSEYALAIGALGAIYVLRRGQHKKDGENGNT